jgi:hypothetical protein
MAKYGFHPTLKTLALTLLVLSVLIGLGLILEHTTHHHDNHNTCGICLLASSLFITAIAIFFCFHVNVTPIEIILQSLYSTPILDLRIIRAPPDLNLNLNR